MRTPSAERIRLMDMVVECYIQNNTVGDQLLMEKLSVSKEEAKWANNATLAMLSELGFCKAQEFGYGDYVLTSWKDKNGASSFLRNEGGFKRYFNDEIENMSFDEKCNLLLSCLASLTKTDMDLIDDHVLIDKTGLSQIEFRAGIKRLANEGLTGGGKLMTSINYQGRDFIKKGGYKDETYPQVAQVIYNNFPDNKGQVAVGNNSTFVTNKPKINPESDEGLTVAKSGVTWAKIGIVAAVILTILGWLLSYYRIWPFR